MNATASGIAITLGPEGSEKFLSLWKVRIRIQVVGIDGEEKAPHCAEWNIVSYGPATAAPMVYSRYSEHQGDKIVSRIEILSIEWLNTVHIAK